ncbi:hypothetical protein RM190_04890 [Paracoccus sp. CPCC 101403]|uniref:Uncharacterized protein n=1 Tax=Paracoccus broussonetiae TaxID=3075834 RepID=A0ABU3EAD2_9RHOB|nr:hypothetical protein [Paracoccus sp. CPCC 101403]MDT1061185.1 hypothetical protein [Paracoccus sp. CPCC 101403]
MTAKHGGKRAGAGRPAGAKARATIEHKRTLSEMAQEHTEDAIRTLAEIMKDDAAPPNARVAAVNVLLDRGYGKPRQEIDHSSTDGTMTPLTGFVLEVMDEADIPGDETAAGLPN